MCVSFLTTVYVFILRRWNITQNGDLSGAIIDGPMVQWFHQSRWCWGTLCSITVAKPTVHVKVMVNPCHWMVGSEKMWKTNGQQWWKSCLNWTPKDDVYIYIYNHGWKNKDCFYFLEFFFRIWSSTGVGEVFEISDPLGPWATPTWPPHFGSIKRGNSQFAFRFPCWGIHSHLVQVDLEDWPIWLTFLRFEGTEYRLSPEEGMAVFF